jgi:pyruvate dehydrogenase E2 component (dihydrolipoamide acetyltransferase)
MPKADENMAEGTVLRWLVGPGAEVGEGEDVVECVADKGEFTVWAEEAGTVVKTFAPEQSVVPVGYVLAAIGGPGEPVPDVESENASILARAREELKATAAGGAFAPERVRATPAARALAKEKGVTLARVAEALAGRIVREADVRDFLEKRDQPQQKDERGEGAPRR